MLTTASAIADVNFTEKTLFTVATDIWKNYYSTFFNQSDAAGITLSNSSSSLGYTPSATYDGQVYNRFYCDKSCSKGNKSYDKNYFQITSNNRDIKFLNLLIGPSDDQICQIIIVGWKGLNTASGNADYVTTETYDENTIKTPEWHIHKLSSWEGVRTIRIYYCLNAGSNLKLNNETVVISGGNAVACPYIYGIQVGLDSNTASISSYGVAAFSSASALDFTTVTECSAFYADSYANGVLHLTKVTGVVPAQFGLLLCSTNEGAVSFSIPIATAASTLTTDDNKFVATDESTYTPTTSTEALALGVKNGKAGFYYVGAGVTVPQYRFYLPAPSVRGAKNLTLDFDNATGITSIPFNDPATQNSVGESAIPSQTTQPTDLLGRPCPTPRAGALYIKGGKAYLTPAR